MIHSETERHIHRHRETQAEVETVRDLTSAGVLLRPITVVECSSLTCAAELTRVSDAYIRVISDS